MAKPDAIVIGSGPNGLATAISLSQAGWSVKVVEAHDKPGGGMRTLSLTRTGYRHDICSAIHPMAAASPFFRSLPLEEHGLEWIYPDYPLAHPTDDGSAVIMDHSIEKTSMNLGIDSRAYRKLFEPLVDEWENLVSDILAPLHWPRHPMLMAKFGLNAHKSAEKLIQQNFEGKKGRALFAGMAAHSVMPLDHKLTSAIGLVLGVMGHATGWPMPKGGSQSLSDALCSVFESHGGTIETNRNIEHIEELPDESVKIFDVTPRQLLEIAGPQLPNAYKKRLKRYRYGPGVCKVDAILNQPIPWSDPKCRKAGTVHVGGTFEEIKHSEEAAWKGIHTQHPYVLVAQQSIFDSSRTPDDSHTLWAYCHVPHGSEENMTEAILNQIERFAPGFKRTVVDIKSHTAIQLQNYNPNYIGGDINGGSQTITQLFSRPVARFSPYTTPKDDIFICSSSTPPGGGVHGMCGFHAAQAVLRKHGDL